MNQIANNNLIESLKYLIGSSREKIVQSVNTTMVQTYWSIGKTLVEDEQQGKARADPDKRD